MGGILRHTHLLAALLVGCTGAESFAPDGGAGVEPSIDAGAPALDAGGGHDAGAPSDAAAPIPTAARTCEMRLDLDVDGSEDGRLSWSYAADGRLVQREVDYRGLDRRLVVHRVVAWDARGEPTRIEHFVEPEGVLHRVETRGYHADGRPDFHALHNALGGLLWRTTWHYDAADLLVRVTQEEPRGGWERLYDVDPRLQTVRVHGTAAEPERWLVWHEDRIVEEQTHGDRASECLRYEHGPDGRVARDVQIDCDSGDDVAGGQVRVHRWDPAAGELRYVREDDPTIAGWVYRNGADGTWSEARYDNDWDGVFDGVWRIEGCGTVDGAPFNAVYDAHGLRLAGVPLSTRASLWDPSRVD